MQHTLSGSVKRLADPLASPGKKQASVSECANVPQNVTLVGGVPEPPPATGLVSDSLDPTNEVSESLTVPEPPESESDSRNLGEGQNSINERKSPRLNGERQHRAVKKFRPPDNVHTLTAELGGQGGIKSRRVLHHCDQQNSAKGQGSSPTNGSHLASCSVSGERKKSPGTIEEKELEAKQEKESNTEDNR